MRVTVTGGTGRLGNVLVRTLLQEGHAVRVLDLAPDSPALAGLDVERMTGSVLDPQGVERGVHGADVVFHLAAKVHVGRDHDGSLHAVNVQGTEHVLAAVERHSARLVHCSSHSALTRGALDEPLREDHPLAHDAPTAYRRSKARAEQLVQQAVQERRVHAVIVNPSVMTGPWDFEPSLIAQALLALARGTLPAVMAAVTDYVDARDVPRSMVMAAERGVPGERYLLTGEVLTMPQLLALWGELSGVRPPRICLPRWLAWSLMPGALLWAALRGAEPALSAGVMDASDGNRVGGHEKASASLGHTPRPLRESLRDTLQFFREQGWLPS
jgi:dihydroflavonol-4-reductase